MALSLLLKETFLVFSAYSKIPLDIIPIAHKTKDLLHRKTLNCISVYRYRVVHIVPAKIDSISLVNVKEMTDNSQIRLEFKTSANLVYEMSLTTNI